MPNLLIRNVPQPMLQQIEGRARRQGVSISDGAKSLLELALMAHEPEQNMADLLRSLVKPEDRGDDLVI